MSKAFPIPSSEQIRARMQACREELTALKRLLRAAEAAEQAERARQARKRRRQGSEVDHAAR